MRNCRAILETSSTPSDAHSGFTNFPEGKQQFLHGSGLGVHVLLSGRRFKPASCDLGQHLVSAVTEGVKKMLEVERQLIAVVFDYFPYSIHEDLRRSLESWDNVRAHNAMCDSCALTNL